MSILPHIDDSVAEPTRRYLAVRRTLAGLDASGRKIAPAIGDRGVISLAQGNGMRRPHPSVLLAGIKALRSARQASVEAYASQSRDSRFDRAITTFFGRLGVPASTAKTICIDSGLTRLLAGFFFAVGKPGDTFLVNRAYYHGFASLAETCHVALVPLETRRESGYKVTADDLRRFRANGGRARGLILVQPSFTGETYEACELAALAGAVVQADLRVFCDMTFACTEHDGDFYRPALASIAPMTEYVVTAMSGSKAYGLANTRIGWACGPSDIIQRMNFYATATGLAVPQVAKSMATAALTAPLSYMAANAREAVRRKQLLLKLIDNVNDRLRAGWSGDGPAPAVAVERIPQSGHSMLLSLDDFRGLSADDGKIRNSLDIARYLLRHAKVAVSPCYAGGIDSCLIRIAFGDLGASATHPASMRREERLLRHRLSDVGRERTPKPKPACKQRSDFSVGRDLLRVALTDRIAPALLRLAKNQAPGAQRIAAYPSIDGAAAVGKSSIETAEAA